MHDHGHDLHHGHDHGHDHGHSHRTGAATRYWREPKPVAITILIFFFLLFWFYVFPQPSSSTSTSSSISKNKIPLPEGIKTVIWVEANDEKAVQGRQIDDSTYIHVLNNIELSCTFKNQTLEKSYSNELNLVRFTLCKTSNCVQFIKNLFPEGNRIIAYRELKNDIDLDEFEHLVSSVDDFFIYIKNKLVHQDPPHSYEKNCQYYPTSSFVPSKEQVSICEKPGDRNCDSLCNQVGWVYRSDLRSCVSGGVCSSLTVASCFDHYIYEKCHVDCEDLFHFAMRKERTRSHTVVVCLVTLFLLGGVLGLLFAKIYWVDPLLEVNEKLKNPNM